MWQIILEELARQAEKQAAKQVGRWAAKKAFNYELSPHEAYVDRIDKEFNLRNYGKARTVYDLDPAYWENLYGDDPVRSWNHPASPPKSLLPRQPGVPVPGYNFFSPAPTDANVLGPFGTAGQFAPGSATSSRPLFETQPSVPPSIGSASPDIIDTTKPVRRLGVRIGDVPGATVFDSGAEAVPFVPPSTIPRPGSPASFDERFQTSPPWTGASPGAASPEDLEAFRRRWLKSHMEP